jgi:lipopolysaccharide export system permease protein
MFRILDRYIFREIAQSWLAVTMVLLAILLTNQFARVLGDVAKDNCRKMRFSRSSALPRCNT